MLYKQKPPVFYQIGGFCFIITFVSMTRFFSTTGIGDPKWHYMVDPFGNLYGKSVV